MWVPIFNFDITNSVIDVMKERKKNSNLLHLKSIMLFIVACSSKNDFFFQKYIKFIPDKVFDNFKEFLLSRFTAGIDQFYHLVIFVLLNSSKEDLCALSWKFLKLK